MENQTPTNPEDSRDKVTNLGHDSLNNSTHESVTKKDLLEYTLLL